MAPGQTIRMGAERRCTDEDFAETADHLDLNLYRGGRSIVGGELRADLQRNSRFGGTVVVPFAGRQAVKFGYSGGVVTSSGGDFNTFLVSYTVILP